MKIFKRIGFGFLIIIALLGIWIAINSIDDSELSEQAKEMLKPMPEVPPEENGYELINYIDAENFSVISSADSQKAIKIAHGEEWDTKFIKRLVSEKKGIIDDVTQAIHRPRFKLPSAKNAFEFPNYQKIYQASRLLILKSRIEANYLNISSAIETLKINVNFCQKVMTEENYYLISYMIGIACVSDSLSVIHEITSKHSLSKTQFTNLRKVISELKPYASDDFEKVFPGEIRFMKSNLGDINKKSLLERIKEVRDSKYLPENRLDDYLRAIFPKYYNLPNAEVNRYAELYYQAQQDTRNYCNNISTTEKYGSNKWSEQTDYFFMPSRFKTAQWDFSEYFERRCLAHTYYDAVSTIIAIQAYKQDHKKLPKDLSELIPTYMDRLPIDYFNGEPLKYSPDDKWLYSVGNDYKDDKGSALGFTRGRCYKPDEKNKCDTNPTFPIDWNEYPVSTR